MKKDIDRLMLEHNLDAMLVRGAADHNPYMAYFTGRVHLSGGYLIKKRGEEPVLFHYSMERDEAKRTGLATKNIDDYKVHELIAAAAGDHLKASATLLKKIFAEYGVKGRISIYGMGEVGATYGTYRLLEQIAPEIEIVPESGASAVLMKARMIKDEAEIKRIRSMGKIATSVVSDVADFLRSNQAKDGILVNREGKAVTIGEVKRRINLWLAMRGAENPEGTIFAMGRDGGIPHSVGQDEQALELGKPIVFDLFPCEDGGGYFYDITRTWCLGYAPDDVQQLYNDVYEVYHRVQTAVKEDMLCKELQDLTCELFAAQGHITVNEDPSTEEGYVHSLAHGLGLNVHEPPMFRSSADNSYTLPKGTVFTLEPGLYYPDKEMGMRLENTFYLNQDGELEKLAEFPLDLVIEIPGA
jgi:Xaa-Pro aminopeptidase